MACMALCVIMSCFSAGACGQGESGEPNLPEVYLPNRGYALTPPDVVRALEDAVEKDDDGLLWICGRLFHDPCAPWSPERYVPAIEAAIRTLQNRGEYASCSVAGLVGVLFERHVEMTQEQEHNHVLILQKNLLGPMEPLTPSVRILSSLAHSGAVDNYATFVGFCLRYPANPYDSFDVIGADFVSLYSKRFDKETLAALLKLYGAGSALRPYLEEVAALRHWNLQVLLASPLHLEQICARYGVKPPESKRVPYLREAQQAEELVSTGPAQ